jgi:hypothetical protein
LRKIARADAPGYVNSQRQLRRIGRFANAQLIRWAPKRVVDHRQLIGAWRRDLLRWTRGIDSATRAATIIDKNLQGKSMSRPSQIRPLQLFGAMIVLAPAVAASAAPPARHAKIPHGAPHAELTARPHESGDDTDTWMMFPVALAAAGFAIRRQQRTLDSLQPQIN